MATVTRRSFLGASVAAAGAGLLTHPAQAGLASGWQTRIETRDGVGDGQPMFVPAEGTDEEQRLFLKVKRTGEVFNDVVRKGPLVYVDALQEIDHLLRDWRRDEVIEMDRDLIALIASIQHEIGYDTPLSIVSGYRTAETNAMLRRKRKGVAKNSYHIKGMAADISFGSVSRAKLRKLALKMHVGGVGYYPGAGFIHVDTGPVRTWRG